MHKPFKTVILFLITVALASCKETYTPPVDDTTTTFLVVEGILNNGGLTTIHLSRTRPLNDDFANPELKAVVSVQDESNQNYALTEQGFGDYTVQLNLDKAKKYRLRIKTANGKEYLSDFEPVLYTPPIDKIYWEKKDTGLDIYADTHDPANNTRYYRWGIEETWTKNVAMNSLYEYINGTFQPRQIPTRRICYDTTASEPLAIASTIKLSQDVVSKALVNNLPAGSHKLADKYSILVKQYALDQKAYEYWQGMKKNTELVGSIFDPQPSYMYGNIRSVSNPKELVIGYFGACNVPAKRIFITAQETKWVATPNILCDLKTVKPEEFEYRFGTLKNQLGWIPIVQIPNSSDWYGVITMACADCGKNWVKPVWWQ